LKLIFSLRGQFLVKLVGIKELGEWRGKKWNKIMIPSLFKKKKIMSALSLANYPSLETEPEQSTQANL